MAQIFVRVDWICFARASELHFLSRPTFSSLSLPSLSLFHLLISGVQHEKQQQKNMKNFQGFSFFFFSFLLFLLSFPAVIVTPLDWLLLLAVVVVAAAAAAGRHHRRRRRHDRWLAAAVVVVVVFEHIFFRSVF